MSLSIKKFLPRSLFGRSLLILVLPVLLIQVITTYMFYDRHWDRMTSRLAYAVSGEITVAARLFESDMDIARVKEVQRDMGYYLDLNFQYREGDKLVYQQPHAPFESMVVQTLSEVLEKHLQRPYSIDVNLPRKKVIVHVQMDDGVLSITLPKRRLFSSSSYIFLLWMLGVSTLLLLIAIVFMRNQIKPIRRLAIAAEKLGKGRPVTVFRPQGATEVRQAAQAFLEMRERITRQIQQRTTMLAGVSHDLRTPLTRIKLQVAMMGESGDVKALQDDIEQMEKMIDGYLDFTKGEGEEGLQRTDLTLLIGRVADASQYQGMHVTFDKDTDLSLMLRPVAMERCLGNLLSNADKYANEIWVDVRRNDSDVQITVEDDGPGIAEELYEEVFKPFYRVDDSRNTKTGGVGLGLPIAAEIVHAHGGKIILNKSDKGGLKVVITLPV